MCDCRHIYVDVWISLLLLLYASKGSMIMVIKYALPEKWMGKNNWITMKNHVYDDDEKCLYGYYNYWDKHKNTPNKSDIFRFALLIYLYVI